MTAQSAYIILRYPELRKEIRVSISQNICFGIIRPGSLSSLRNPDHRESLRKGGSSGKPRPWLDAAQFSSLKPAAGVNCGERMFLPVLRRLARKIKPVETGQ
jgi:hypothetical protein